MQEPIGRSREHLLLGQQPPTGRQPRQSAPPASSPPHGGARETSGRRVKELIHAVKIVSLPKKVTKRTLNNLNNIYIYLKKQNSTNKEAHD